MKPDQDVKVLIAYHANCIDGFTAAWACWRGLLGTTSILNENINLMEVTYDKQAALKDAAKYYDKIYIVDFSIPVDDFVYISTKVDDVVIIDHHKTAYELYGDFSRVTHEEFIFDINECGSSLVWKYFFPASPLPNLIRVVRDYDLWKFELAFTRALNRVLRLEKKNLINWQRLEGIFEDPAKLLELKANGVAINEYHASIVSELVSQAEFCNIAGEEGLCVNCSSQFSSDVGHALAKLSGTFGATWQQESGGKVKWSLRSIKDYDVSTLAARFNGGGHKTAAGFYLKAPQEDMNNLGITLWAE